MKNLFKIMMFVAAAATGFASCSEDAVDDCAGAPADATVGTKTITVRADIENTRISMNDDHTKFVWTVGDELGVFTDSKGPIKLTYAEGSTSFEIEAAANDQNVYAYYPHFSNTGTPNNDKSKISLYISSSQDQDEAGKLRGNTTSGSGQYPLVAKGTIDANNKVDLSFRPVACAFALNIYGAHAADEKIKSVSFTPASSINCCGQQIVDLTSTDPIVYKGSKNEKVTVTLGTPFEPDTEKPADKNSYNKQVYICVAKANYSAGGTFVVTTTMGTTPETTTETTYTFTTEKALDCSNCDLYAINMNLEKGVRPAPPAPVVEKTYTKVTTAPADWSGQYIIAYEGNIMTGAADGNYLAKETVTAFDETTITCSSQYEITIEKSTADGYYTLKNSEGKYIGLVNSDDTEAKLGDNANEDNFLWKLDLTTTPIKNKLNEKRNIRYNNSTTFRVYSSTNTGSAPSFYTISGPTVSVSGKEFSLAAGDTAEHSFTYSAYGEGAVLSGVAMTQDSGADWLNAQSDNNGTVTYQALSENTAETARTATLTLSIADGNSVTVTITQAAPAKQLTVTPTVDGTTVSWTITPAGATAAEYKYLVTTESSVTEEQMSSDPNTKTTTETSVDLSTLGLETGTYYVHIQALGDNLNYTNSAIAVTPAIHVEKSSSNFRWITNFSDITAGDYYIATPGGNLYNGKIKSGHLQATSAAATVKNGLVFDIPEDAVVVTFTATGTANQYQLKDANNKYINATEAKSGYFSITNTQTTSWTFSNNTKGELVAVGSNVSAHFRSYNNASFRTYSGDNNQAIYLVKIE